MIILSNKYLAGNQTLLFVGGPLSARVSKVSKCQFAHKRMQPKYSRNASNTLPVPTTPQTHESLCCSEAVDMQDDERLQRCCGTASWRQMADSWKCLIFNLVQCHLWKTTDSVAGVFKCRHRGREHWRAGYLRLKIAALISFHHQQQQQHQQQ